MAKTKRVFLDTNILIDYLAVRDPHYASAAMIMQMGLEGKLKLFASAYGMGTVFYLFAKETNHKNAFKQLKNIRPLLKIATTDQQVLDEALNSEFHDFEDALQYYSAIKAKCHLFFTRNIKAYQADYIPVISPEDYLKT